MAIDLIVHGGGTIYTLHPVSVQGHAWIAEHIPVDAPRLRDAVAVEHRYIRDLLTGMVSDGLTLGVL